jgi:hypothetical protein
MLKNIKIVTDLESNFKAQEIAAKYAKGDTMRVHSNDNGTVDIIFKVPNRKMNSLRKDIHQLRGEDLSKKKSA